MTSYPDHTRIAQTLLDQQSQIASLTAQLATHTAEAADVADMIAAGFHAAGNPSASDGARAVATELRRLAAADDTTGAAPGCWCGHPADRHYTGARMSFPAGCKDCPDWDGAHAYGQELPWATDRPDDTTGA